MNKLRRSTYTHTPSGTKSKDVALLLLSLSILHYFSKARRRHGKMKSFYRTVYTRSFRQMPIFMKGREIMNDNEYNTNINIMPMLALRGLVVYPYMITSLEVGREKSKQAVFKAEENGGFIFLVSQKDPESEDISTDNLYNIGTIAKIQQVTKRPGGLVSAVVEGISQGEITKVISADPYYEAVITESEHIKSPVTSELQALSQSVLDLCISCTKQLGGINAVKPENIPESIAPDEVERILYLVAGSLDLPISAKQAILEKEPLEDKFNFALEALNEELLMFRLQDKIDSKVRRNLDDKQREYYLREQIKVIEDELGEYDDDADELESKLAKTKLPKNVRAKLEKEMDKLKKSSPGSADAGLLRSYIEYALELPWLKSSTENKDIHLAKEILDADHYGLEKLKERIIEYLAVKMLTNNVQSSILCLVGPPGVGKTSVAKSIARSMNRNYVRISLGGIKDEADIRGHRKTYIGAMAGRIIEAIREAKTNNPLILLDEIDKIGSDMRGDPSAALLEVLDGEQNREFRDHFLEIPFDLSNVVFVTTANTLETVDRPLLDRLEVIELPGYTEEEKVKIAEKYLIPKQMKRHGLKENQLKISKTVLHDIINYYTREMGVRSLEKQISKLCRKAAGGIVMDGKNGISVTGRNLTSLLGEKIFSFDKASEENIVGVATGLAWTQVGGDTLSIETNIMDGSGKIELTGQLGDVMKESAMAAISFLRANARELGIDSDFYKNRDIHIHVPEGATPKDGPSAGITMATAIMSALSNRAVKSNVAMTGEITIRGRVLPIGGLKEKSLAAYRSGVDTIIIPRENKKDLKEIPDVVKNNISFICVSDIHQVFDAALEADLKRKVSEKQKKRSYLPAEDKSAFINE